MQQVATEVKITQLKSVSSFVFGPMKERKMYEGGLTPRQI